LITIEFEAFIFVIRKIVPTFCFFFGRGRKKIIFLSSTFFYLVPINFLQPFPPHFCRHWTSNNIDRACTYLDDQHFTSQAFFIFKTEKCPYLSYGIPITLYNIAWYKTATETALSLMTGCLQCLACWGRVRSKSSQQPQTIKRSSRKSEVQITRSARAHKSSSRAYNDFSFPKSEFTHVVQHVACKPRLYTPRREDDHEYDAISRLEPKNDSGRLSIIKLSCSERGCPIFGENIYIYIWYILWNIVMV